LLIGEGLPNIASIHSPLWMWGGGAHRKFAYKFIFKPFKTISTDLPCWYPCVDLPPQENLSKSSSNSEDNIHSQPLCISRVHWLQSMKCI
jgi:hypothetical protein